MLRKPNRTRKSLGIFRKGIYEQRAKRERERAAAMNVIETYRRKNEFASHGLSVSIHKLAKELDTDAR